MGQVDAPAAGVGVGAGVGVWPLPYPSGGSDVVRVGHATAVVGTVTEGAVPHAVNVSVWAPPPSL
jgi:hypothetical protein